MEWFEAVLLENDKDVCLLAVSVENGRAIRFYERNGYVAYLEKHGQTRAYAKHLR